MARAYPRFLFSNPKNTKSKGPFIIHTLPPQVICKVIPLKNRDFTLDYLDCFDSAYNGEISEVMNAMKGWLFNQLDTAEIYFDQLL